MRRATRRLRYRAWGHLVEYASRRFVVVCNSLPTGDRPLWHGEASHVRTTWHTSP
jgi:hypothetical protein